MPAGFFQEKTKGGEIVKVTLTSKSFKMSDRFKRSILEKINKIESIFPKFHENLPELYLVIRRNKVRQYFEGSLKISIPKKVLFARFESDDAANSIERAFNKIYKEAEVYKGKHFKSYSKYKDHSSVRRWES